MYDPILVTLLKMRPHDSQSCPEYLTPSSSTSQLPSYKEVSPPPAPQTGRGVLIKPGTMNILEHLVTFWNTYNYRHYEKNNLKLNIFQN